MFNMLFPKVFVDSIYHIDYINLQKRDINILIFDVDNTLVPFDVKTPDDKLIQHFNDLKKLGFKIALVSNNSEKRVTGFNEKLNFHIVYKAAKPMTSGLKRVINHFSAEYKNVALIGDQIFTDVFGGNRLGLFTILVKPISNRDEFSVKLKRGLEKMIVNIYIKQHTKKRNL